MPWNSDSWKLLGSADIAASALLAIVLKVMVGRDVMMLNRVEHLRLGIDDHLAAAVGDLGVVDVIQEDAGRHIALGCSAVDEIRVLAEDEAAPVSGRDGINVVLARSRILADGGVIVGREVDGPRMAALDDAGTRRPCRR